MMTMFRGNLSNAHQDAIDWIKPDHFQTLQLLPGSISTVVDRISEQAKHQPDAVALSCGGIHLSYGALLSRANHLAEYLRQQAPVAGGTVAICLERSVDWIVAAFAIMRAGAAYVPLEPLWPEARIRHAVKDSGACALMARRSALDHLKLDLPGMDPHSDAQVIEKCIGIADCVVSPESLAYVIYTSGSTGAPKGVEITHANLAHLVRWHREAFRVSPQDRASHLAGLGFDASAWEIWPSLCAGAMVCIPDEAVLSSPDSARKWMLREEITISFVPSIYAATLMEMEWPAATPLRFLLTGGDVLHRGPRKQLPFTVVNNYGPTECTVVATSATLDVADSGLPAIGRPVTGTTVYLLDESCNEVPVGSPGEIYIGGDGVGRGYRNLPELTRERFVADTFDPASGGRLYRTGDLALLRPDGQIQFLGRLDRQVKIRGKRLELDEVASVLSRHSSISLATVVASSDLAGEDKRLVAYVVFKPECEASENELVAHLSEQLPDFMIPAVFVRLEQMPLSANGKLDYAALPAPAGANLLQSYAKEKPVTPIERQLFDVIQNLLRGRSIGMDDNVFLVGGDSLFGMQLILELKNKFKVEPRFDQIFEAGTVRDLARLVEEMQREKQASLVQDKGSGAMHPELLKGDTQAETKPSLPPGVISAHKTPSSKTLFWVHYLSVNLNRALGQERHVTFLMLAPEDISTLGQAPTVSEVAALFVRKILMTQPLGPYTLGGYCLGSILAYEIAIQLRKAEYVVDLLMLLDPPTPSYLKTPHYMWATLSTPIYLARRIQHAGLRGTLRKIRLRVRENLSQLGIGTSKEAKKAPIQKLLEAAASTYSGDGYDGRVLMMLAAEKPPHVDFLPGWKALISRDLRCEYINCHHDDLMKEPHVQQIAKVITANLEDVSNALPIPANLDVVLSSGPDRNGFAVQKIFGLVSK